MFTKICDHHLTLIDPIFIFGRFIVFVGMMTPIIK